MGKDNKEMVKKEESALEKGRETKILMPRVDIFENADEIRVLADMPGVQKEDVVVQIEKDILLLSGLRRCDGQDDPTWKNRCDLEYVRRFQVPKTIDADKVNARLKDGVLTLHLPKSEGAKPRMIAVKAA